MAIPRIYHPQTLNTGTMTQLGEDYIVYLRDVLRLGEEDELILFDGVGHEYRSVIRKFTPGAIRVEVIAQEEITLPETRITLAQSLPKGDKMKFIIQKTTELGVSRIVPFISSRSVPRLTGDRAAGKATRWRKVAVEASRQCGRADVPEVSEIVPFDEMLRSAEGETLRIILWEGEEKRGVREILTDERYAETDGYCIVIGPEGGFSWEEIERARRHGFLSASLGRLILRTETAPLAVLSILQYEKGLFGTSKEKAP